MLVAELILIIFGILRIPISQAVLDDPLCNQLALKTPTEDSFLTHSGQGRSIDTPVPNVVRALYVRIELLELCLPEGLRNIPSHAL